MAIFEAIDDILLNISQLNECSKALVTLASALGVVIVVFYAINLLFKLIQVFRLYFVHQYCCQTDFVTKYGKWAVISGSTDGIGQCMARELARRGMSIIVIGRNDERLARTKALLEQEPNVGDVETVKIDLSDSSVDNFNSIRAQIDPDNRDIGVLINNAGAYADKAARYCKFDMEGIVKLVNLNTLAVLHLTRMIMPGMVQRGKGLVLNVSSVLGSMPGPYTSVYAATKTFVDTFTRQLQLEYSSHPLDIILLTPGPIYTKLFTNVATMRSNCFIPAADDFARSTINALSARPSRYSGTLAHGCVLVLCKFVSALGIVPILFRVNMRLNTKNFELSPVPKRRRFELQTSPAGAAGSTSHPEYASLAAERATKEAKD